MIKTREKLLNLYNEYNEIINKLEDNDIYINILDRKQDDLLSIIIQSYGFPEENSDLEDKDCFLYDYLLDILLNETIPFKERDKKLKNEYKKL